MEQQTGADEKQHGSMAKRQGKKKQASVHSVNKRDEKRGQEEQERRVHEKHGGYHMRVEVRQQQRFRGAVSQDCPGKTAEQQHKQRPFVIRKEMQVLERSPPLFHKSLDRFGLGDQM